MGIKQTQVQRWVDQKIIDQSQAQKILKDIESFTKENASNRWIAIISIIGAILLGLAAILFISSNWSKMTGGMKVLFALVVTFGALASGWHLQFKTKTYPRIGSAILLLSMLLIGGTYALVSQVYHLDGPMWGFFLLWVLSVLPAAYVFESRVILRLSVILLILTMGFFITKDTSFLIWDLFDILAIGPAFLLGLLILFLVGSLHFLKDKWVDFGRTYRFMALVLVMIVMFIATFQDGFRELFVRSLRNVDLTKMWIAIVLACGLGFLYGFGVKTDAKEKRASVLGVVTLLVFIIATLYLYSQSSFGDSYSSYRIFRNANSITPWHVMVIFANLWFIGMIVGLFYLGSRFEIMALINLATFAAIAYIFARYITLFNDMMSTSAFFFVGGVLLITTAVFAERKRRKIREAFDN